MEIYEIAFLLSLVAIIILIVITVIMVYIFKNTKNTINSKKMVDKEDRSSPLQALDMFDTRIIASKNCKFINREMELAYCVNKIKYGESVVLTGEMGVGKTQFLYQLEDKMATVHNPQSQPNFLHQSQEQRF